MRRVESSIGTASPSPNPATAVLIPTTRARPSASAPPEFPGLSAASVWITFSTTRPAWAGSARPRALTTPAVTDPANPIGFPIATTSWPTRSSSASPSSAGSTVPPPCSRSTARSESSSRPTTSNGTSRPSTNEADPRSVPPTTCAEVSANPSGVMTTPEPAPSTPAATHLLPNPEARDRRDQAFGDRGDHARVRVERLLLRAAVHPFHVLA